MRMGNVPPQRPVRGFLTGACWKRGLAWSCMLALLGCGSSGSGLGPGPVPDPPTAQGIALENAFPALSFNQPVAMLQAPGDPSRWYVVERAGRILSFDNAAGVSTTAEFASLSSRVNSVGEGGLLGMAFHPDYASNRAVFVTYTGGNPLESRLAVFFAESDGLTLDESSETVLIRQEEPFSNHNVGQLAFGPGPASAQEYLYVGFGDGGSGGDPNNNGQNPFNFHGAMLRIDVSALTAYGIPPDNPFANGLDGAPEVFAFGFRNPWRFSFDTATGTLWAGDVGQDRFEEIDIVTAGGNYGWRCYEGSSQFDISNCPDPATFIFPAAAYAHPSGGASVTGGYVYRGSEIESLQSVYVFGDFLTGTIRGLSEEAGGGFRTDILLESGLNIVSFAQDAAGEIYVIDFSGGLYKVIRGD